MNSVLNAPLPHPQIPQSHEGEAPGLLPSLAIAEKDSYQEKQKLLTGGRPQARRSDLTVGSLSGGSSSAGGLFKSLFSILLIPILNAEHAHMDTYHVLF